MATNGNYSLNLACDHDPTASAVYDCTTKHACLEQARADGWIFYKGEEIVFHPDNPPPTVGTVRASMLGDNWDARHHLGVPHMCADARARYLGS